MYAIGPPLHSAVSALVGGAPAAATNASKGPAWIGGWSPTDAEVDALHGQFCDALVALFDRHKATYGWESKRLQLV